MGRLIQSTEKIQELLDKVEKNEFVSVDSSLSTESENPVQNKVITEELGKKVDETDMATINGKSLTEGGNIVIEGGTSATPDWNASEGKAGFIQNKIGGDVHLNSLKGVSYITLEDGSRAYRTYGEVYYSKCKDNYSGGYRWYRLSYTERFEYLQDACYGTREWGSENGYQYRFPTADEINDNYMLEGTIICYIDPEYMVGYDYIEDIVYWGYNETGVENPIPEWFISNEVARQESVDELREETTALWENLDHGTFPNLTAGDLAGRGESVPAEFGFRASGGKSIKDGRAYIKRIKGNSVVWNNMVRKNADTSSASGVTATWDGEKIHLQGVFNAEGDKNIYSMIQQLSLRIGHKYALILRGGQYTSFYTSRSFVSPSIYREVILEANGEYGDITLRVDPLASAGQSIDEYVTMQVTDLTKMFQAGNEPTTIEEFNARVATLGIDMNAYNEGQVIHCNIESIKSVGDNAWDERWEQGAIESDGSINSEAYRRTTSYTRVLPNEEYFLACPESAGFGRYAYYDANYTPIKVEITEGYPANKKFTTPSGASYLRITLGSGYGTTYNHDILISLFHSGWKAQKDDQYQPYWQDTLPLPIIRKYFPNGMKKAGSAHDEIRFNKASGKWEYSKGRIKAYNLGNAQWADDEWGGVQAFSTRTAITDAVVCGADSMPNLICSRYVGVGKFSGDILRASDRLITLNSEAHSPNTLAVRDSTYTDAASLKAAMQDVMLYYESNDWEWVELDEADQNFRDYYTVADFGTEEAIPATNAEGNIIPSAAFSADIIYQFNAVDMIREHEMEINELQSVIATMQAQLTSLINK
jgi:hypothetical protein